MCFANTFSNNEAVSTIFTSSNARKHLFSAVEKILLTKTDHSLVRGESFPMY